LTLYIDADGCPVVDIAVKLAADAGLECFIICNTSHYFDRPPARTITVDKGADSADFVLVNMLRAGDAVVTQDYGLAAMCLARGAVVVNQDGFVYTNDNIDAMLQFRHTSKKIRNAGGRLKGAPKRRVEQDENFAAALGGVLLVNK